MTKDVIIDVRGTNNQLRPIIFWVEVGGHFYGCAEVYVEWVGLGRVLLVEGGE